MPEGEVSEEKPSGPFMLLAGLKQLVKGRSVGVGFAEDFSILSPLEELEDEVVDFPISKELLFVIVYLLLSGSTVGEHFRPG